MAGFLNRTTGTITANGQSVPLDYRHFSNGAVGVQVTGTFTGTLVFEMSLDGTTFATADAVSIGDTATPITSLTAPGIFRFEAVGARTVRVRASAWTSGTAAITLVAMDG